MYSDCRFRSKYAMHLISMETIEIKTVNNLAISYSIQYTNIYIHFKQTFHKKKWLKTIKIQIIL